MIIWGRDINGCATDATLKDIQFYKISNDIEAFQFLDRLHSFWFALAPTCIPYTRLKMPDCHWEFKFPIQLDKERILGAAMRKNTQLDKYFFGQEQVKEGFYQIYHTPMPERYILEGWKFYVAWNYNPKHERLIKNDS